MAGAESSKPRRATPGLRGLSPGHAQARRLANGTCSGGGGLTCDPELVHQFFSREGRQFRAADEAPQRVLRVAQLLIEFEQEFSWPVETNNVVRFHGFPAEGPASRQRSDGILESENAEQEEFGSERLTSLLSGISPGDSAQRITEQILAATDGHSGVGIAPHDDRTLIVLRLTEEASSDFSKLPIIY